MIADFGKNGKALYAKSVLRPVGDYLYVHADYDTIWRENLNGKPIVLSHLDRNSRNELLAGKRQGSGWNAPSGQAVPSTLKFDGEYSISATDDFQWWLFNLNAPFASSLDRAKKDWASCLRGNAWITNKNGTDTNRDPINNNGKGGEVKILSLITTPAILKKVGVDGKYWYAEAIGADGFRNYNPVQHPWLFFTPTVSERKRFPLNEKSGEYEYECWYTSPMFFFGYRMSFPVLGTTKDSRSSTGYSVKFPLYRARLLGKNEAVQNPFNARNGTAYVNPYAAWR